MIEIYFAEKFNEDFLKENLNKYVLFDKLSLGKLENKNEIDKHFNNYLIINSLKKIIKEGSKIVYLLYSSNPDNIIKNLRENFTDYKFSFNLILEDIVFDYDENNYDQILYDI
jgi:NADH dehydrogenase FAD-containing subunit